MASGKGGQTWQRISADMKYSEAAERVYASEALEWVYQETKDNKRLLALTESNGWEVQTETCKARVEMLEWLQAKITMEVGKK